MYLFLCVLSWRFWLSWLLTVNWILQIALRMICRHVLSMRCNVTMEAALIFFSNVTDISTVQTARMNLTVEVCCCLWFSLKTYLFHQSLWWFWWWWDGDDDGGWCVCLFIYCNIDGYVSWDWSLISTTNWLSSVHWHCWLGHMTLKPFPKRHIICRVGRCVRPSLTQ